LLFVTFDFRFAPFAWIESVGGLFVIALFAFVYGSYEQEAKKLVSDNVTFGALNKVFTHVTHNPNGSVSMSDIRAAKLFRNWSGCSGSDKVTAEYRGLRLVFSDIKLTYEENDETMTAFEGQWLIIDLSKTLNANLRVIDRRTSSGRLDGKSDIETESMEFNRKFQILTDDPHTAFLILTPQFMEFINRISAKAGARICLWFSNSSVHIALHSGRNLFEIETGANPLEPRPESIIELRDRIKNEIGYITGVLDELALNDYLFGR
jgi:hypothetical protein